MLIQRKLGIPGERPKPPSPSDSSCVVPTLLMRAAASYRPRERLGACAWDLRDRRSTEQPERPNGAPPKGKSFHDHVNNRQGPRRYIRHHLARRRQCPGATMTFEEKLDSPRCSTTWASMSRGRFPDHFRRRFPGRQRDRPRSRNSVIAGLSRAQSERHRRCAEAVKFARRGRVHTVIATSRCICG